MRIQIQIWMRMPVQILRRHLDLDLSGPEKFGCLSPQKRTGILPGGRRGQLLRPCFQFRFLFELLDAALSG